MARIDKVAASDSFRAPLAGAYTGSPTPVAVSLDANGRVVVGSLGTTADNKCVGIICIPENKAALEVVDVLKQGELVEVAGLTAGTWYFANTTTGALETTVPAAGANKARIGHTVEATRLVINVASVQGGT